MVRTPLLAAPGPSERLGRPVFLKLENLQRTGSFKIRGAANRLLALSPAERSRGVATCSSGNHGKAVARMAQVLGVPAVVCVPRWVDPSKLSGIRETGAETVREGETYDAAEARGVELARERGLVWVSPFDDPYVVAGQGTVGLEIAEQLTGWGPAGPERPAEASILVPLSGGGLAAGVALAVRHHLAGARVYGVSARRARVMVESLRAGRPVSMEEEETLANALAGGIGPDNRITFPLVRRLLDGYLLVDEDEVAEAMAHAFRTLRLVVEGGGAVGLAALRSGREAEGGLPAGAGPRSGPWSGGGPVVVVVSGGNVELRRLATLL